MWHTPLFQNVFNTSIHSHLNHMFPITNEIDHNKSERSIEKGMKKCTNSAPQQHFMNWWHAKYQDMFPPPKLTKGGTNIVLVYGFRYTLLCK
jgi:hypothetical protein